MEAKSKKPEPSSKVILVVDDDPHVLSVIVDQLEFYGYSVIAAKSGEEAMDIVQNKNPIMVVLLDIGLPGLDGFEILSQMKRIKPDLQVIMVTGDHKEEDARRALELGAWDYVTKPIDFAYLKNILLFHS